MYLHGTLLSQLGREAEAAPILVQREEAYVVRETVTELRRRARTNEDHPDLHAEITAMYMRLRDVEEAQAAVHVGLGGKEPGHHERDDRR